MKTLQMSPWPELTTPRYCDHKIPISFFPFLLCDSVFSHFTLVIPHDTSPFLIGSYSHSIFCNLRLVAARLRLRREKDSTALSVIIKPTKALIWDTTTMVNTTEDDTNAINVTLRAKLRATLNHTTGWNMKSPTLTLLTNVIDVNLKHKIHQAWAGTRNGYILIFP